MAFTLVILCFDCDYMSYQNYHSKYLRTNFANFIGLSNPRIKKPSIYERNLETKSAP